VVGTSLTPLPFRRYHLLKIIKGAIKIYVFLQKMDTMAIPGGVGGVELTNVDE
jgi:hypothetical protein